MNYKVVLVIIYNHRFDQNIDRIEKIYNDRFSHIFHLMPFYDGNKSNVISVYGNSYYFQGYIAQGLEHFFSEEFTHYFFIADDLILNPIINEANCSEHFQLNADTCFVSSFISLHKRESYWRRVREAYDYRTEKPGVEVKSELPSYNEALQKFHAFKLEIGSLKFNQIHQRESVGLNSFFYPRTIINQLKWLGFKIQNLLGKQYQLSYPLIGGYSDIFIVSKNNIKKFCQLCGIFAATDLFAELAIPTSLILTASEIIHEDKLLLNGKALWVEQDFDELNKYGYSLESLLSGFPSNYLYLHPIKLSKWKW